MSPVNPVALDIRLLTDILDGRPEAWGSEEGTKAREKIARAAAVRPEAMVIRISLKGMRRVDSSFARECVVELACQFRGRRGVCVTDVPSKDVLDNLHSAAVTRDRPLVVWDAKDPQFIGPKLSEDTRDILKLVMKRGEVGTAEAAKILGKQVNNVSTRLKRLSDEGLVLRRDVNASTGGLEFRYLSIQ